VVVVENDENVSMGEATFLKLNGVNKGFDFSEDIPFIQIIQERMQFQIENPTDYMRCVFCFLARVECFCNE